MERAAGFYHWRAFMKIRQNANNGGIRRYVLQCFAITLLFPMISPAQTTNENPNYTDEIISLKGKAIKGNIIKIDGTTLYVEITKNNGTEIITYDINSLKEIRKDFGSIKIEIGNRTTQKTVAEALSTSTVRETPSPVSLSARKDTAAALTIERDSIYVGALDKEDTYKTQSALVDHLPSRLKSTGTEYPSEAIKERLEGVVELRLWIDKEGIPRKYKLVQCTDPIFVENSVASVMKWEFSPATVKGTPVGVWASVSFEYKFQK
jgi:TonB family protein